jgi:hypothetical protein
VRVDHHAHALAKKVLIINEQHANGRVHTPTVRSA